MRLVREHGYGVMGREKSGQVRKRMPYVPPSARIRSPVQADQQGVVPWLLDAGECELDAGDVRDDFNAIPAELQNSPVCLCRRKADLPTPGGRWALSPG